MAASEKVTALAQLAAEAINEKLGVDIVAIDMTEQMVLSEVFLLATAANERQADGIAAAKNKGIYKGRPPSINQDKIKKHLLEGKRPTQIAKELEISRGTIYKVKQLIALEPPIAPASLDYSKIYIENKL